MPETMQGTRIHRWDGQATLAPGEYAKHEPTQKFHAVTPNGALANLGGHEVTEHEDGTITVSPSIKVSRGATELWHGFLERGVWRSC